MVEEWIEDGVEFGFARPSVSQDTSVRLVSVPEGGFSRSWELAPKKSVFQNEFKAVQTQFISGRRLLGLILLFTAVMGILVTVGAMYPHKAPSTVTGEVAGVTEAKAEDAGYNTEVYQLVRGQDVSKGTFTLVKREAPADHFLSAYGVSYAYAYTQVYKDQYTDVYTLVGSNVYGLEENWLDTTDEDGNSL